MTVARSLGILYFRVLRYTRPLLCRLRSGASQVHPPVGKTSASLVCLACSKAGGLPVDGLASKTFAMGLPIYLTSDHVGSAGKPPVNRASVFGLSRATRWGDSLIQSLAKASLALWTLRILPLYTLIFDYLALLFEPRRQVKISSNYYRCFPRKYDGTFLPIDRSSLLQIYPTLI